MSQIYCISGDLSDRKMMSNVAKWQIANFAFSQNTIPLFTIIIFQLFFVNYSISLAQGS